MKPKKLKPAYHEDGFPLTGKLRLIFGETRRKLESCTAAETARRRMIARQQKKSYK